MPGHVSSVADALASIRAATYTEHATNRLDPLMDRAGFVFFTGEAMDGRKSNIPTFRRLKSVKAGLERDIFNRIEYLESTYARDAPDRWQQANSYHAENERDQEIVDEIDWVLEYFRPNASSWPGWAYVVLGAVAAVVVVFALLALVK